MNHVPNEGKVDFSKPILWIVIPCYNEKDVLPITAPMFLEQDVYKRQDTGEKGPGWYNSYTKEVYWDNNCNNERTKIEAQKEVVKSLKYLSADINGGIKFFYKKIASEWNEPTFESLWINNKLRNRNQDIPKWVQNFFDGQNILSELYVEAYRIILFLLWMGILIFLYLERKTDNIMNLLWLIIFIGGFLFHLFWEAKGQYTLIYVWLCIPCLLYTSRCV